MALSDIVGTHSLTITGVSVANLLPTLSVVSVIGAGISDSAAHVAADLDGLQTLMTGGKITGVTVTDGGSLTVTASQMVYDANLISNINGNYSLNVIGVNLAALSPTIVSHAAAQNTAHSIVLTDFSASQEFLGDVTVTAQNPASTQHWLLLTT